MDAHARNQLAAQFGDIASQAGEFIMSIYAAAPQIQTKADGSPVSEADIGAERLIRERLHQVLPDVPLLAEESFDPKQQTAMPERFLLVDPLDGTREFINRNGEFTVNIAEIEGGRAVRGVVFAPAKNRLFFGERETGAFEIATVAGTSPDFAKATSIVARRAPSDGLVAVASRSHRDAKTEEYLAHYPVKDFVTAGSSLKFCLVAAGEADIYPRHGRTMEWDTAAGQAVLEAAGGSVKTIDGRPFIYGKTDERFANPFFVARGAI
jgi:3'(2'), 5'-bisphosphate nucleotidase